MNRLYYAYARHALVTALRMARVQSGDNVLLPSFICRDVLASLKAINATPVFYEIDVGLQVSSQSKLPPAKALLAVNYFGFPADLERIQQQLTDPSTVLIEDNAHGWLSCDEHGVPLGTRTPLGITSFRKTVLALDGAYLHWSGDCQLDYSALHPPLTPRTELIPLTFRLRKLASWLDYRTHLPIRPLAQTLIRYGRRSIRRPAIAENPAEEFQLPHLRAMHASSLAIMTQVDRTEEISRRRTLFKTVAELAAEHNIEPVFTNLPSGVSPQGFAYYSGAGNVRRFHRQIQRQRLGEAMSWPSLPRHTCITPESRLLTLKIVNFIQ